MACEIFAGAVIDLWSSHHTWQWNMDAARPFKRVRLLMQQTKMPRSHQGQSTVSQDSGPVGLSCHLILNMIHLDLDQLQHLLRNADNALALWQISSAYTDYPDTTLFLHYATHDQICLEMLYHGDWGIILLFPWQRSSGFISICDGDQLFQPYQVRLKIHPVYSENKHRITEINWVLKVSEDNNEIFVLFWRIKHWSYITLTTKWLFSFG